MARAKLVSDTAARTSQNDVLNHLASENSTDVSAWNSMCSRQTANDAQLITRLTAGLWPTAARQAVVTFITALKSEHSLYAKCAVQAKLSSINKTIVSIQNGPAATAEQFTRLALGLSGA